MKFQRLLASVVFLFAPLLAVHAQPAGTDAFRKGLEEKLSAGKTAEAIAFFTDEMKQANKQDKPALRDEFLRSMARAGKPLEAYRAFPGGKGAFAVLAEQLIGSGHDKLLGELVAEHALFFEDDPFVDVYRGQAAFATGKFAEADAHWTAAFRSIHDEYLTELFQGRRVLTRFKVGKVVDMYLEDNSSFWRLANLCLAEKRHADLEKLFEAQLKQESYGSYAVVEFRFRMQPKADFATLQKIALSVATPLMQPAVQEANRDVFSHMARQGRALEAYRAAPDPRAAFHDLGRTLVIYGRFAETRQLIELHRNKVPDDPEIANIEVEMLVEMNQLERAIAMMKKAREKLAEAPPPPPVNKGGFAPSNIVRRSNAEVAYVLAAYLRGGGLIAYEELGHRESDFTDLARMYLEDRDAAGLEALMKVRPKATPAVERRKWKYEAQLKLLVGNIDDALAIFEARPKSASGLNDLIGPGGFGPGGGGKGKAKKNGPGAGGFKLSDTVVKREEIEFAREMAELGHGLAAYRAIGNPDLFRTLATHFHRHDDVANLAQLLEEHRKKKPGDPDLPTFTAYLALMKGQPRVAEQIFRGELAKRSDRPIKKAAGLASKFDATEQQLRDGLTTALVRQGKAVELYRIHGGDTEAFERFAFRCVDEKDAAQLEALLAVHRQGHPKASLRRYEAELAFLKGDYQASLTGFKNNDGPDDDRDPSGYTSRDKYLVSLVRLKRFEEAMRLAEDWETNCPIHNPVMQILPFAAAGNVEQTMRLMQVHGKRRSNLVAFYGHEDLGPLLRGEAMRTVRERFPEPVK